MPPLLRTSGQAFLVILLLVPVAQPAAAQDAARSAVLQAMAHYTRLIQLVNSDSVAAVYTADAELLEPGMAPLRGREAIRSFLAPFDGQAVVDTVESGTDQLEVYGPVAYQWGTYHQVARLRGQAPAAFYGRYVAQWRLEGDGAWRLARLLMQPAPAPTR